MATDAEAIEHTRRWVGSVVVGFGFCPFAASELARDSIHYSVSRKTGIEDCLKVFIEGCLLLDEDSEKETSLLIYPDAFTGFEDYLDFVALAEDLLIGQGYEGIYQLASFHPLYCFANADHDDPANYTNRSPYPMLHLLREASLDQALEKYSQPELIPQRNIDTARKMGLEKMQQLLGACLKT